MSENNKDVESRRLSERGDSLRDVMGYPKKVMMIRATVGDPVIGQMDYVFIAPRPLQAGAAERAIASILEGDEVRRPEERLLVKAIEHACTVGLYKGEECSVVVSAVDNEHIYQATNPGEYFYDGPEPRRGSVIAMADENGFPDLVDKQRIDSEPGLR